MYGSCDQFLTRTGLSKNENRHICGSHLFHLVQHIFQCIALTDDVIEIVLES